MDTQICQQQVLSRNSKKIKKNYKTLTLEDTQVCDNLQQSLQSSPQKKIKGAKSSTREKKQISENTSSQSIQKKKLKQLSENFEPFTHEIYYPAPIQQMLRLKRNLSLLDINSISKVLQSPADSEVNDAIKKMQLAAQIQNQTFQDLMRDQKQQLISYNEFQEDEKNYTTNNTPSTYSQSAQKQQIKNQNDFLIEQKENDYKGSQNQILLQNHSHLIQLIQNNINNNNNIINNNHFELEQHFDRYNQANNYNNNNLNNNINSSKYSDYSDFIGFNKQDEQRIQQTVEEDDDLLSFVRETDINNNKKKSNIQPTIEIDDFDKLLSLEY